MVIVSDFGYLAPFLLAVAAGVGIAYAVWCMTQERRHFEELRKRPCLAPREWYRDFFGEDGNQHAIAIDLLSKLAVCLDIQIGQLRPSDRFDKELSLGSRWILDQRLDHFEEELRAIIRKHGVVAMPEFLKSSTSLATFIIEIEKALDKQVAA